MNTPSTCRHRRHLTPFEMRAIGAAGLIFLAGCASIPAPTEQVAVTTEAVAHAAGAGATEMAPAELRTARDKLEQARQAMASKDYGRARTLAQQAQLDARLAEAKTDSIKARKAADALREDGRVLREEINRKSP